MLSLDRDAIARLCHKHGVRRLSVFGSAVTDRFDPARSDVDFLVEFKDGLSSRFDAYFGLKEDLETLLERPVDLVETGALKNPYVAASIERSAQDLYAA